MTAQRRARRRRRRGPRPAARHSQSGTAPGPRWPISGLRAAANRGAREAGAQLGAAGHGSVGRRRVPLRSDPPQAGAPSPVPGKQRARQHPSCSRFTGLCNGPRSCAAGPRNRRFFSTHCQEAPVCKEREWGALGRGQGARAWWTPSPPGLASRALPRAEVTRTVHTPTVCQQVLSARGGEPSSSLTPGPAVLRRESTVNG